MNHEPSCCHYNGLTGLCNCSASHTHSLTRKKTGPKPRADRSTVICIARQVKWSSNQIASIEAARHDGETWSACVRRLVEQSIDHLALTQNSDSAS